MEVLGNHDYSFLLDDEKNQHMIVAVGIFEKFDFVTMKNYMAEKCSLTNKCSSKLVKFAGFYWYKKMSKEEWKSKSKDVFLLADHVRNEE